MSYRNQINKQFATNKKIYRDISGKKPIRTVLTKTPNIEPKNKITVEDTPLLRKKINHDIEKLKIVNNVIDDNNLNDPNLDNSSNSDSEPDIQENTESIDTPIIINPMPAAGVINIDLLEEHIKLKDRVINLELHTKSLISEIDNLTKYQKYIVDQFNRLSKEFANLKNKSD